jgi:hypothetical protein
VATFVDRGVSRGQRGGSPTAVNLIYVESNTLYNIALVILDIIHSTLLYLERNFLETEFSRRLQVEPTQ